MRCVNNSTVHYMAYPVSKTRMSEAIQTHRIVLIRSVTCSGEEELRTAAEL